MFSCAFCGKHSCETNDLEHAPTACPSLGEAYTEIETLYSGENLKIAQAAARVEAADYCRTTRVEETMMFAREMGMKKLGIAFCAGLKREAAIREITGLCCASIIWEERRNYGRRTIPSRSVLLNIAEKIPAC